jgi:hypothetical protein
MSSGRVSRKVPFGALPTAVRTADTITASFMMFSAASPLDVRKGFAFPSDSIVLHFLVVRGVASNQQKS